MKDDERSDARRIFLTALLVYVAFWNPWLQNSMTFTFLDPVVSFVETGRWEMGHASLSEYTDTARVGDRVLPAAPPGASFLVVPLYLGWRSLVGPIHDWSGFAAFNGFLALTVAPLASALAATQVSALAGWLGAGRRGRIAAAFLFAFGTQNFFLGTTFYKENLAALAAVLAARLTFEPGGGVRRLAAGALAGVAGLLAFPAGLLAPCLAVLTWRREGARAAAAWLLGLVPAVIVLAAYNAALLGSVAQFAYFLRGDHPRLTWPSPTVLFDLTFGPRSGLFFYSPFLLLAAWRVGLESARARGEALVTLVFLLAIMALSAAWLAFWSDRAFASFGLGPRLAFPAVPLLTAFAGPGLERLGRATLAVVAVPSVVFAYLSAQAGEIPAGDSLLYAVKTWVSGSGMGVFFKEALPAWLGVPTVHTALGHHELTVRQLILRPADGLRLARNQIALLVLNAAVLAVIGVVVRRLWSPRGVAGEPATVG
jgi:hypothetical protein